MIGGGRAYPGPDRSGIVRTNLPGRNGQTLAPLGAAALQHDTSVLRVHPNKKPVGAPTVTAIWLIRTLHWTPGRVELHPGETQIVADTRKAVNVRIDGTSSALSGQTPCGRVAGLSPGPRHGGSFPHLCKNLWKSDVSII
jgi:hypothetical protein